MTSSRRIRGVVFDKDGTLFDFQASWSKWATNLLVGLSRDDLQLARKVGNKLGFDLETQEFDSKSPLVANTPEAILDSLRHEYPNWSARDIGNLISMCSFDAEMVEAVPLKALLDGLRDQGYCLGVATNDAEGIAKAHLGTAGVVDLFEFIAGYDSVQYPKPAPDMLLAFCRTTGIPPKETVMVGDSMFDIVAGYTADTHTVGVLTGGEARSRLSVLADAVLDNIGLLPDWLADANIQPDIGNVSN